MACESAGIILLQSEDYFYRFELFRAASGCLSLRLVLAAGKEEEIIASGECRTSLEISAQMPEEPGSQAPETRLVLAARCDEMKLSFFYGKDQYSLKRFTDNADGRLLSTEYAGGFTGTLAGVYASGNGTTTDNYADVLWAEYQGRSP
jgi:alpha-N-arabinofuranosidase